MAKASAEGGATQYVAEGDPVPDDVPEGVRLVGPGAPVADPEPAEGNGQAPEAEGEAEAKPEVEPVIGEQGPELIAGFGPVPDGAKPDSISGDGEDEGPPDYMAYRVVDLRDLCRDRGLPVTGSKADLAAALAAWDAGHPDGGDAPDSEAPAAAPQRQPWPGDY